MIVSDALSRSPVSAGNETDREQEDVESYVCAVTNLWPV